MQNPMQMMQQLSSFMNGYRGNAKDEAMKLIQGLNQQQLNDLQNQANAIYAMGQRMGMFK